MSAAALRIKATDLLDRAARANAGPTGDTDALRAQMEVAAVFLEGCAEISDALDRVTQALGGGASAGAGSGTGVVDI